MLCIWTGVSPSICPQTIVTLHLGHLLLAFLAVQFGERIFNQMSDWYADGLK